MEDDIVPEEFWCPRCGGILKEKRPKDKRLVRNEEITVRIFCPCGYYRDEILPAKDSESS
jgi:hypothetical protein